MNYYNIHSQTHKYAEFVMFLYCPGLYTYVKHTFFCLLSGSAGGIGYRDIGTYYPSSLRCQGMWLKQTWHHVSFRTSTASERCTVLVRVMSAKREAVLPVV